MAEECDIILVSPPSRMINHYRPPLALMYVAGYYVAQGLKVKIIDIPMKQIVRDRGFLKNRENLINNIKTKMLYEIAHLKAKWIGISCYSPEYEEVKSFIEDIRKINSAEIMVGGIHPTLYPEDFKGLTNFVCQGRYDNGYPAYNLVDGNYYSNANPYCIRGVYLRCYYILSSFGCPSSCTFCVAPKLRKHFGIAQLKNPKTLYEEINHVKKKYQIDGFYFIDDLFTLKKSNVLEFCHLIRACKLLWGCSSKVTTLDEEILKTMSESGCVQIDLGIERGSNEELKKLKKGITIEQVNRVCAWCKQYHIRVFANFLVGLPQETAKDIKDIEWLAKEIKADAVSFNDFTPYQGTKLYEGGAKKDCSEELQRYIAKNMKKYNSIWSSLRFALSWRYLSCILRSKRKLNYLTQISVLIKEILNQC